MTTLTDRELLHWAAKAINGGSWHPITHDTPNGRPWNPLANDGDALRLAVKLGIGVLHDYPKYGAYVFVEGNHIPDAVHLYEYHQEDAYAATRRVIVRAAAAIGQAMEKTA